jgi:polyhydroxybutyrate depolymerase
MKAFLKMIFIVVMFYSPYLIMAQVETKSFEFKGYTRDYIVYLPQNYQENLPVLFTLPGYNLTAQFMMDATLLNDVADTAGFIVVYPNAIENHWNSGVAENPGYPTPYVDDVGFFSALIDTLFAHYNIDLSRVYTCGFSNGGFMSSTLVFQLGYRFAAAAAVGGTMSNSTANNWCSVESFPILLMHGTADETAPYNGTTGVYPVEQTLDYWIGKNKCIGEPDTVLLPYVDVSDGSTVEKIIYSNCTDNSQVILYKVINGGHDWPGYCCGNMDINASAEIWNFVKNFSRTPIAFARDVSVYVIPGTDTVKISAQVENPNEHNLSVLAYIQSRDSLVADSLALFDDGNNNDGEFNDGLWGEIWLAPADERLYDINIKTLSLDSSSFTVTPNSAQFATAGPVEYAGFDPFGDSLFYSGGIKQFRIILKNLGSVTPITNVTAKLSSEDSLISVSLASSSFSDILPGQSEISNSSYLIEISKEFERDTTIYLDISIYSNYHYNDRFPFWTDTMPLGIVTSVHEENNMAPRQFALLQNYPNPFNPSTKIQYSLPKPETVKIDVYNTLGQRVEALLNQHMKAGNHEVDFNAQNLSSGIYFYRIEAGEFQDVKKMVFLR